MQLYISRDINLKFWWISVTSCFANDKKIAKLVGISLEQYQSELLQFITNKEDPICPNGDIIFYNLNEVELALEYLENKYGVLLALVGE